MVMASNDSTRPILQEITLGTTVDEPQFAVAATNRPNPYDRHEYYRTYDPMTGVRIATTLTGFFAFTVVYILCKGRCGRRRIPVPSRRTSQATSTADVEDPLMPPFGPEHDLNWWQTDESYYQINEKKCHHQDCQYACLKKEILPWEEEGYWRTLGFKGSLNWPLEQNRSFESCGSSSCQCRQATKSLPGSALRIDPSLQQSQMSLACSENTSYSGEMCSTCSVCQNERKKPAGSAGETMEPTKKRILPMRSVSFRESDLPSREEQNSFKVRKPPIRAVSFREEDCDSLTPLPVTNKPSLKKLSRSVTTVEVLPLEKSPRSKSILRASSVSESNYATQKLGKHGRPSIPRYCLLCRSSSKQKLHQCFRSISLNESDNPPCYIQKPAAINSRTSSNTSMASSHKSTPRGSMTQVNKGIVSLKNHLSLDLRTMSHDSAMPSWRSESVDTNATASRIDICITQPTPSASPCASMKTLSDSLDAAFIQVIPASPLHSPSPGKASDRRRKFAQGRAKGTTLDWTEEEFQTSFSELESVSFDDRRARPPMDYLTVPSHHVRYQAEEPMRPCSDCGLPKNGKEGKSTSRDRLDMSETSFIEVPKINLGRSLETPKLNLPRSPSRSLERSLSVAETVESRRSMFSASRNATFDCTYSRQDVLNTKLS